jgi:Nickel responsive protein SCO4226-like
MKIFVFGIVAAVMINACKQSAKLSSSDFSSKDQVRLQPMQSKTTTGNETLFLDVHDIGPGKVTFDDVMAAHQKDLATEGKYGVNFIKFWVDEEKGKVYCLASAKDSNSMIETHREAHGLVPQHVYTVTAGQEALLTDNKNLFLDVHYLGAGNVTKEVVAGAHQKDLAVEKKYGVNFINYWVDEKSGTVFCLSQAPDSNAIINTHKEAHGLLPAYVLKVRQGQ